MTPLEREGNNALSWARDFIKDFSGTPNRNIRAYANGLRSHSLHAEPTEGLILVCRAEALLALLKEKEGQEHEG